MKIEPSTKINVIFKINGNIQEIFLDHVSNNAFYLFMIRKKCRFKIFLEISSMNIQNGDK